MPIPDYQTLMLPLLRCTADGQEHYVRDVVNTLADQFRLSTEERRQLLPSGRTLVIKSRVGWARTYLKKAGLLESPRRGVIQITKRGRDVLNDGPTRIDTSFLEQFPEFVTFKNLRHESAEKSTPTVESAETPEEVMENAFQQLHGNLASRVGAPPS